MKKPAVHSQSQFRVNQVIEFLILSDFFILFALGLLSPIFAIFISKQIAGGDLKVIGLAATIYWIIRSILATPLSRYMDKTDGEKDEWLFMFCGTLVTAALPLGYIFASVPWHIYALQGLLAVAYSMAVPGWRILFTNHLDRGRTGYEWSLEDMGVGLGTATAAYFGAVIAETFGFATLFVCISGIGFVGALLLIPIRGQLKTRQAVAAVKKKRRLRVLVHSR